MNRYVILNLLKPGLITAIHNSINQSVFCRSLILHLASRSRPGVGPGVSRSRTTLRFIDIGIPSPNILLVSKVFSYKLPLQMESNWETIQDIRHTKQSNYAPYLMKETLSCQILECSKHFLIHFYRYLCFFGLYLVLPETHDCRIIDTATLYFLTEKNTLVQSLLN